MGKSKIIFDRREMNCSIFRKILLKFISDRKEANN